MGEYLAQVWAIGWPLVVFAAAACAVVGVYDLAARRWERLK